MSSAKPLKLPVSTPFKPSNGSQSPTNEAPPSTATSGPGAVVNPADITSPHELTAFVETLLEHLDSKFDDMSSQILEKIKANYHVVNQMSSRVDALETSIQDIINSDFTNGPSVPQSPSLASGARRSGST